MTDIMTEDNFNNLLKHKSDSIRKDVVETAVANGAEHIAPSLSCIDILTVLYYEIMDVSRTNWEERDRFILSKGHGCYGLYSILADKGILPAESWKNFHKGSFLTGCVERYPEYGLEASCGSLGHGLPFAVGIAFGAKLQNKKFKVYCLVGDGEMQEGTMWEAVQFASKHKLDNLTLIIDNNGLQAMDFTENVLVKERDRDHFVKKLEAFGFIAESCNGHDIEEMKSILSDRRELSGIPKALIANTIKGYGLLCMENIPKFHFRMPSKAELEMGNRYEL